MARIRWILIIIGVSVLLVFSLANTNSVPIRMPLVFEKKVPLAMLLAGSALIGFMIGALWTAWMLRPPGNNRPGNNRPGAIPQARTIQTLHKKPPEHLVQIENGASNGHGSCQDLRGFVLPAETSGEFR